MVDITEKRLRRNRLNRIQRLLAKEEAIERMGGRCTICKGVFHSSCYDFHHTDPSQKDVEPGSLVRGSREVLYKELAKCILLCANCHRKLHWEIDNADTDWSERPKQKLSLEYNGRTQTLMEWSHETGIGYETLRARVREYGWDAEKALTTPVREGATSKVTILEALGEKKTLREWAEFTGVPVPTLRSRIRKGWDADRVVTQPLGR